MSLSFCNECDIVVEGNTHVRAGDEEVVCDFCDEPVHQYSEDDPRKPR